MGNGEWKIEKCEIVDSVQLSDSVVVDGVMRLNYYFPFFFKHLPFES